MRSQSSIGIIGEADAESVPEMDIRHEIRMGAKVELLGEYFHPQHLGDTAWRIRAYRVDGQMVAGTNGDSVWQEQVPDDFAALLADYGAPSKWPKAVKT